ncbi:unnamed protein product [Darwinula stevensoni]|uniref:Ig-like domain-containing protein n=1 Tax=Darwinula stevensoni TaxID=69355 RepID=A0A7R9A977_9CRUS|nr:unnamed protein product [Darwinula stevensoni]CAG0897091.1 unnamed protein product [Darwinula stevensoni]
MREASRRKTGGGDPESLIKQDPHRVWDVGRTTWSRGAMIGLLGLHSALAFLVFSCCKSANLCQGGIARAEDAGGEHPRFLSPVENITVSLGDDAVLACSVSHLGTHKIAWVREEVEGPTVMTLNEKVVLDNSRVSISTEGNRIWTLRIRHVSPGDIGCYMCQVNAQQMLSRVGCIRTRGLSGVDGHGVDGYGVEGHGVDGYEPPSINEAESSSDVTAKEGEDVQLSCRARGNPDPEIKWKREDDAHIQLRKADTHNSLQRYGSRDWIRFQLVKGEGLQLSKIDRRQAGSYLCIASNDVPPAVSKRIRVTVLCEAASRIMFFI